MMDVCMEDKTVEAIEAAADTILAQVGIRFDDDPQTLELWHAQGARVVDTTVYLDGAQLREIIRATSPAQFTLIARDKTQDCIVGCDHPPVFAPVYGPPDVLLRNGQRTPGSKQLYRELVAMADACEAMRNTGHMLCVLNDVPEPDRPAEMAQAHLEISTKPFMGAMMSPKAALDVIDLTRTATHREIQTDNAACHLLHLVNSTPPLTYGANPLKCLRAVAEKGEGCLVTSFMMLGATGPASVAGALAQGYAECMAGLALAQLWRSGTPVIMGLYATQFSMRSMLPWFGDPLSQTVQLHAAKLARHLGVPVRGDGGLTSSCVDDAQAGSEGSRATSAAVAAGCDFILHAAGWLESGRCVSITKFEREAAALSAQLASFRQPSINT